jgi:hypothetical protein
VFDSCTVATTEELGLRFEAVGREQCFGATSSAVCDFCIIFVVVVQWNWAKVTDLYILTRRKTLQLYRGCTAVLVQKHCELVQLYKYPPGAKYLPFLHELPWLYFAKKCNKVGTARNATIALLGDQVRVRTA